MKILRQIWDDIRRGENVDLYLIVTVAISLSVANLFGVGQTWTASITLLVLGLIAISTLVSRDRIENLIQKISQSTDTVFQEEFPTSLKTDIESGTEIWFVGVTLLRTIRTYYSTIEQKLREGNRVKVLLVNPNGKAIEMAETRVYGRIDVERTRKDILGSLQDLCVLKKNAQDNLQIRTIESPLTYGAVVINPESASGAVYLEHYAFKPKGGPKPKIVLRAKDGHWYDFFKEEVRTLWENGGDVTCNYG